MRLQKNLQVQQKLSQKHSTRESDGRAWKLVFASFWSLLLKIYTMVLQRPLASWWEIGTVYKSLRKRN